MKLELIKVKYLQAFPLFLLFNSEKYNLRAYHYQIKSGLRISMVRTRWCDRICLEGMGLGLAFEWNMNIRKLK